MSDFTHHSLLHLPSSLAVRLGSSLRPIAAKQQPSLGARHLTLVHLHCRRSALALDCTGSREATGSSSGNDSDICMRSSSADSRGTAAAGYRTGESVAMAAGTTIPARRRCICSEERPRGLNVHRVTACRPRRVGQRAPVWAQHGIRAGGQSETRRSWKQQRVQGGSCRCCC